MRRRLSSARRVVRAIAGVYAAAIASSVTGTARHPRRRLPPSPATSNEGTTRRGRSYCRRERLVIFPSGEELELLTAAGRACGSTRAELATLGVALEAVQEM